MFTGVILSLAAILIIVLLFVFKKEMIIKMFTLNISAPASEFTEQLEQTADSIIRRLEDETAHLELLLEEAETKIGMLSRQVEHANDLINKLTDLEERRLVFEQIEPALPEDKEDTIPVMETQRESEVINHTTELANESDIIDQDETDRVTPEKHRLIMAMADQGYNVTEIAKATGMGKGEIILLLQLNKK